MTKKLENEMAIGSLPFYWRIKYNKEELHPSLPGRMDYTFEYLPELDLIQHKRTPALLSTLERMYLENSNIGFLQDGHNLAKGYGEDFYNFLIKLIKSYHVKNILEIGCGACYLLEKLKRDGANVSGIDPSPIAIKAGELKDINVIPDFFPSKQMMIKQDLIFHVDVLEHVPNPIDFLEEQKNCLSENGIIVINVPDCSETIKNGDISIALHQHLNNFDLLSLANVIESAGLRVVDIQRSGFGGSLYAVATKIRMFESSFIKPKERNGADYFARATKAFSKFENDVLPLLSAGQSVGFYMPLRAFPYLSMAGVQEGYRLFDDINHWHRGFVDGSNIAIENFDDLIQNPVNHLFIMSFTFGKSVKNKILKKISGINIKTIQEILE